MGTASYTFTENYESTNKASWTVNFISGDIPATGATVSITPPVMQAKYVFSGKSYGYVSAIAEIEYSRGSYQYIESAGWYRPEYQSSANSQSMSSGTFYNIPLGLLGASGSGTIPSSLGSPAVLNTSTLFDASNNTVRTVPLYVKYPYTSGGSHLASGANQAFTSKFNAVDPSTPTRKQVCNIVLDVPPTFTKSAISYDRGYIYAGLTTASITISDLTAYYGGTISEVTFTIGNQSVSRSSNGTLSIALSAAGTFTPTVTATDSRGQTTTETYSPITVLTYYPPTVSFNAERTTSTGVPDDEGTYATLDATLTFSDAIVDAVVPSVVMTDENGTQTTPVISWYTTRASDGTLSGSVTWSSLSSGDTVYCLVQGLNTNYSYVISVRPRDSQGTGTAISQTVSSAFYTVDFLAGGHGIAFGKPASSAGFECAMDATFDSDATFGADLFIDLSDYQTADTTDKSIYDTVIALGWDSEVLV